jgi:hypothetical protein
MKEKQSASPNQNRLGIVRNACVLTWMSLAVELCVCKIYIPKQLVLQVRDIPKSNFGEHTATNTLIESDTCIHCYSWNTLYAQ